MPADLDTLEKRVIAADSAADLSELTAQILAHVARHSGQTAEHTGDSAGHLKDLVDKTGDSAGHLKDLVDETGASAGHLKTLAEKAVESARHQDTIATALQAVAHRGAQGNPLHVTFEHPREIKVSLHEETLSKIVAVWTGGDGVVDDRIRRELLEYLLILRNAVAGALTGTHRAKFEDATLPLAEKCAAERRSLTAE
jgi:hypothetical protein